MSQCNTYNCFRHTQTKPPQSHEIPDKPWQSLREDLFDLSFMYFLIDHYSKFMELPQQAHQTNDYSYKADRCHRLTQAPPVRLSYQTAVKESNGLLPHAVSLLGLGRVQALFLALVLLARTPGVDLRVWPWKCHSPVASPLKVVPSPPKLPQQLLLILEFHHHVNHLVYGLSRQGYETVKANKHKYFAQDPKTPYTLLRSIRNTQIYAPICISLPQFSFITLKNYLGLGRVHNPGCSQSFPWSS